MKSAIPPALMIIVLAVLAYFVPVQNSPVSQGPGLDSSFGIVQLGIQLNGTNSTTTYYAYLATTTLQQDRGYMNQTSLGDCRGMSPCIGMLFLFNSTQTLCFWMRNTLLPLEQSWIAENGTVLYEYEGMPNSNRTVCFNGVAVLETSSNQALPVGSKVKIQ